MTDNLTAELARLNAGYRKDWDASLVEVYEAADEFLDLANKLHALLVQAEGAFNELLESQHHGHDPVITDILSKLHAAGIGGSDGK